MGKYLNTKELSSYLGISKPTLQRWRTEGNGIPFIKKGGIVIYDIDDVDAWTKEHKRCHTAEGA